MEDEDLARLMVIARSRTEPASRVERARMLLAYREDPSLFAVGRALGVHHQTVQRCVERAVAYGVLAALDDRPRPGKESSITAEFTTGALAVIRYAKIHGTKHRPWLTALLTRRPTKVAAIALANKIARIAWAMMAKGARGLTRSRRASGVM